MNDTPQSPDTQNVQATAPATSPAGGGASSSLPPVDMSTFKPEGNTSALPPVDMSTFKPVSATTAPTDTMQATTPGSEWESGNANPNDSAVKRGLVHLSGAAQGAGASVIGTVAGLAQLLPPVQDAEAIVKHIDPQLAGRISGYIGKLTSATTSPSQKVGNYAETLGEFLSGDEAFKGLGTADKMLETGKIAKVIEKSPKLSAALRLGVNVSKASGELSPEELALVKDHPVLARLVGAGYDAIRHGAVQGAQTYVQTGNVGEAAKQGAEMAGTSAALGIPLGIAGGVAAKTGNAAELHQALNVEAAQAPTPEAVRNQVESTVKGALNPESAAAETAKTTAGNDINQFQKGTPSNQHLTEATQQYATDSQKAYRDAYVNGIEGIKGDLAGETIPYEGSPLHQAAQELVQGGKENAKPLDVGFKKTRPGSPELNQRLDFLANPNAKSELPEGTEGPAEKPPINLDINELIGRRKELGEQLRNTGWSTDTERQDRGIYKNLMQGVDDSIEQLAQNTTAHVQALDPNAPSVLDRYKAINNDYRQSSRVFENKDVQNILAGNQTDVMQRLLGGATNLDDINDVKKAFGDQVYNRFATDALQRFVADNVDDTGNLNYKTLLQKWNKLGGKPEVRDAAFGQFNANTFSNVLNGAVGADKTLNDVNNTLAQVMGNGDVNALVKDPARLKQMASVVGPDGMAEVGKANLQSEVGKAARTTDIKGNTIYRFDPDKFMAWVSTMKDNPEAMDTLYKSTPEATANFDKLLKNVGTVKAQKIRTMLGLGAAGVAAAGTVGGPMAGFITLIGEGVGAGAIGPMRQILERIATHPAMLKTLQVGGKVGTALTGPLTQAVAAKTALPAARATAKAGVSAAKSIYSAAQGALSGGTQ